MSNHVSKLVGEFDRVVSEKRAGLNKLGTRSDGLEKLSVFKRKFEELVDVALAAGETSPEGKVAIDKLQKILDQAKQVETRPRKSVRDERTKTSFKQWLNSKEQPWERR